MTPHLSNKRTSLMLSLPCAAMLFACNQGTPDSNTDVTYDHREQSIGNYDRLSGQERAAYIADMQYIHDRLRPDIPISLNMADPRQYRFVKARLRLVGKTPGNSPHLFEAIEDRRREHLASGYGPGLLAEKEIQTLGTAERTDMHFIETASIGESTGQATGTANTTFPGGSFYTYTDVDYTDAGGTPLGSPAMVEEYGGGTNVQVSTSANLSLTSLSRYRVSSMKVEDSSAGFDLQYIYTTMGSETPITTFVLPQVGTPVVDAPLDIRYDDGVISVCLNRTWTQDCDYDLTGNPQSIKLPLKGSVSVISAHLIDVTAINGVIQDLANGIARPEMGHVKLILTNVGGGCDVTDMDTLYASMSQFWNHESVSISPDSKTFSWDLTDDNAAFFDDECRQLQDFAKLTMRIVIPLVDATTGDKARSSITLSNDPEVLRPDYTYKPINITNSCLAEGTLIELAGGNVSPIEAIKSGDMTFNPYHDISQALTVMDTAKGFENVPMVRIADESGRSLLMTEMHPIQTVDRGMVQARHLRQGDMVMTKTGPSKLVKVAREEHDGGVYNLKVGSEAEMKGLGDDQTVVYANGFLVGDGQIQSKYEMLSMTRNEGDVLERLPRKWHQDYLMSQRTR